MPIAPASTTQHHYNDSISRARLDLDLIYTSILPCRSLVLHR
jgi:hypothetical protein